ncbi:hypothetical protein N9W34_00010 [Rickettsiales bacterium]|nr:hypothetical protein [Rickettsiales bacterium]
MSMEWYRAYHGMPYDTKLRVIAKRTSQPMAVVVAIWACMLDAASQHDPRGFIKIDPEEVAVVQDLELEVVEAVLQAFRDKGMIDENNHLTAWDIRAWRYYCEIIGSSDFCLGKLDGKDWTIDLTWAIASSDHVAKILEGGFSGGKHPTPPPACHDPKLQTGWDHVLACFASKYGKATCKSWLSGTEVRGVEQSPDGPFVIIACRNGFTQQWLQQHYQTDLNLWWSEHSYNSRRIVGVQLTIKEA